MTHIPPLLRDLSPGAVPKHTFTNLPKSISKPPGTDFQEAQMGPNEEILASLLKLLLRILNYAEKVFSWPLFLKTPGKPVPSCNVAMNEAFWNAPV